MKNKSNRGQITIFICAAVCVFLVLLVAISQGIRTWEGRAKSGQAVAAAADSLKGDFQPELFRRYHLLALDKTYYGRGEGYLEERVKEYLEYTLNPMQGLYCFQIEDVMLEDSKSLTDNELWGMRQQIREYMEQKLPINVLEQVQERLEKIHTQEDSSLLEAEYTDSVSQTEDSSDGIGNPTKEQLRLSGLEEILQNQEMEDGKEWTLENLMELDLGGQEQLNDPKETLEALIKTDILRLVMPDQAMSVSRESLLTADLPSAAMDRNPEAALWYEETKISCTSDLTALLSQDTAGSLDNDTLTKEELYGIAYALDSFSCFGKVGTEADFHAFTYEIEYMIAGQGSDYENLSQVAEELCLIRFLPNAAYAFTDSDMKDTALLVSTLLLAPVGMAGAAKPVSYVFLACWAYAESILDVRCLFQGGAVPFIKTKDTWQLSLNQIKNIASKEGNGCAREEGLSYEDYLVFLLAAAPDQVLKYYRMLDIIQLNLKEEEPQFQISNCICDFRLEVKLRENHNHWFIEEQEGYLPE